MPVDDKFVLMVTPSDALAFAAMALKADRRDLVDKIRVAYDLWRQDNDLQDEYDREPY